MAAAASQSPTQEKVYLFLEEVMNAAGNRPDQESYLRTLEGTEGPEAFPLYRRGMLKGAQLVRGGAPRRVRASMGRRHGARCKNCVDSACFALKHAWWLPPADAAAGVRGVSVPVLPWVVW